MNYDGPSFYKKSDLNDQGEKSQEIKTPLNRLKKEQERRNQLNEKFIRNQKQRKEIHPENYYFRSTQIPKSLQSRDGWKKEMWEEDLVIALQKRLKKEQEDYLLFSDHLFEEVITEEIEKSNGNKSEDTSDEAMRIKKMVAEIESTLDTAALVQHEMKPDLTKPNTGLHRTLSNIIAEDKNGFENGKNNLGSLFSDKGNKNK